MVTALRIAGFYIKKKTKDPRWWSVAVIMPLVVLFLLGFGFSVFFEDGVMMEPFEVLLINQDTHSIISMIETQLLADESLGRLVTITPIDDPVSARQELSAGNIAAVIILPKGMITALEAGENREISLWLNPNKPFEGRLVKGIMEHFMKSVSGGQSAVYTVWDYFGELGFDVTEKNRKIQPVMQDITLRAYRTRDQLLDTEVLEDFKTMEPHQYYATAMLVLFVMFLGLQESREWLKERKSGIRTRMQMAGVSPGTYLQAQFWRIFFLAGLQTLIFTGIMIYLAIFPKEQAGWFLALYGSMTFLVTGLALLLGVWVREEESYQVLLNSLLLLVALLGGGLIPLHYMPEFLSNIARGTIHYWMLIGTDAILGNELSVVRNITGGMLVLGIMTLSLSRLLAGKEHFQWS